MINSKSMYGVQKVSTVVWLFLNEIAEFYKVYVHTSPLTNILFINSKSHVTNNL